MTRNSVVLCVCDQGGQLLVVCGLPLRRRQVPRPEHAQAPPGPASHVHFNDGLLYQDHRGRGRRSALSGLHSRLPQARSLHHHLPHPHRQAQPEAAGNADKKYKKDCESSINRHCVCYEKIIYWTIKDGKSNLLNPPYQREN